MKVKTEQKTPRRRGRPPGTGHKQKLALQQGVFGLLDGKSAQDNDLVMFENESTAMNVTVRPKQKSSFRINISQDRLDIYRSPHTLDLRVANQIEKIAPVMPESRTDDSYSDLPGGELLARAGVFSFIDFDRSPIAQMVKRSYLAFKNQIRSNHEDHLLEPKLAVSHSSSGYNWNTHAAETTIGHLLWLIWLVGDRTASVIGWFRDAMVAWWRTARASDEVLALNFSDRTMPAISTVSSAPKPELFEDVAPAVEAIPTPLPLILIKQSAPSQIEIERPLIRQSAPAFAATRPSFWSWSFSWRLALRPVAAFVLIAVMIAMPFKLIAYWQAVNMTKGQVLGDAERALASLHDARDALTGFDLLGAQTSFDLAHQSFTEAQEQLAGINSLLTTLADISPIDNSYKSGKNLLDLGTHLSAAGDIILVAVNAANSSSSPATLTERLKTMQSASQQALGELEQAEQALAGVNSDHLPADSQEQFTKLKSALPSMITGLKQSSQLLTMSTSALGDRQLRRYLIMFQNDNELRPTGGFMGSFALVDLVDGKIKNITIPKGGTYDMRAGLKERFSAPSPLRLINPRWEFQDVNWSPDWPTSAQTIMDFYQRSNGPSVDGVIAINSDWLAEVLRATGPIVLTEYGLTLTGDNIEMELQKSIEFDLEVKDPKAPKKIITDLAPKLLEKIFASDPSTMISLAQAVRKGLAEKEIQIYFKDENLRQYAGEHEWDGRVKQAPFDYLQIVTANIGAGKSDQVIDQDIRHLADISPDGTVTDTVEITRRHFGPIDDYFTIQPNASYLRAYVPTGSRLISAAGFSPAPKGTSTDSKLADHPLLKHESERVIDPLSGTAIYNENGKTVFANWFNLKPGEQKTAVLVYRLPNPIAVISKQQPSRWWDKLSKASDQAIVDNESVYSILIQKQSGAAAGQIDSQVSYPTGWRPTISYPLASSTAAGLIFTADFNQDQWRAINFARP